MSVSPVFWVFETFYYTGLDIAYVVIIWLNVLLVARSKWRPHLNWLMPFAIGGTLQLGYRVIYDIHLAGLHWTPFFYALHWTLIIVGGAINMYGSVVLWRTWKRTIRQAPSQGVPKSVGAAELEDVWPPPPTIDRR